MFSQYQPSQSEKICVVGMGPTGLAFIASMLEKTKKLPLKSYEITVFEKRSSQFTRRQRLVDIKPNVLMSEDSWESFLSHLFLDADNSSDELSQMNARQKFIRKLSRQSMTFICRQANIKNFSIKALQKAILEHILTHEIKNVSINWQTEVIIDDINISKQLLTIKDRSESKIQYEFDTLVICEGATRTITKQINAAVLSEGINTEPFQFQAFSNQLPRRNVSCLLSINILQENISKERLNFNFQKLEFAKKLFDLGWHPSTENIEFPTFVLDDNLYKGAIGINNWRPKAFITSEIPEAILAIANQEMRQQKMMEWITILASYRLRLPVECFEIAAEKIIENNILMLMDFDSKAEYVNNPVMKLPGKGQIILLGDCSLSPVYQAGISSTIGLNEAIIAATCITSRHLTSEKKDCFEGVNKAHQSYQKRIDGFIKNSIYASLFHNKINAAENSQEPRQSYMHKFA